MARVSFKNPCCLPFVTTLLKMKTMTCFSSVVLTVDCVDITFYEVYRLEKMFS